MAKQRRATLKAVGSPAVAPQAEAELESTPPRPPKPATAAHSGRRRDTRELSETEVIYARIPRAAKRRVDIAKATLGVELAQLVGTLLDAYVDPGDELKMAELEQLLAARR